jgi:hypothetical protein
MIHVIKSLQDEEQLAQPPRSSSEGDKGAPRDEASLLQSPGGGKQHARALQD